jgi:hypothetical protein
LLLEEATQALARLDAETLGRLEERALRLQALLAEGLSIGSMREIAARHRVFAAVVQATGESLSILQRASSSGGYERTRNGPRSPWGL